jgi:hypothetical protein
MSRTTAGRVCALAPLPLVVLALAGCGGGSEADASALPACAAAAPAVARPGELPESFPLPEGTVLESSSEQAGFTVVKGHVPGGLEEARDFFAEELPKAGYELEGGDAEEEEAETEFGGEAEGKLKLRTVPGCADALTLELAVRR